MLIRDFLFPLFLFLLHENTRFSSEEWVSFTSLINDDWVTKIQGRSNWELVFTYIPICQTVMIT